MRYIADTDGYVKQVSFGADILCDGAECTEYTGSIPSGYKTLEAWFLEEAEKLYRWKIVNGNLTLDSSAVAPSEYPIDTGWQTPNLSTNMTSGGTVRYRQLGKVVYVRASTTTAIELTASSSANIKLVASGLPAPAYTQYGAGAAGYSNAIFYVTPVGHDSGAGRLVFFGISSTVASGSSIRTSFSYLID